METNSFKLAALEYHSSLGNDLCRLKLEIGHRHFKMQREIRLRARNEKKTNVETITRNLLFAGLNSNQLEMHLKGQHAPDLIVVKLLKRSSFI